MAASITPQQSEKINRQAVENLKRLSTPLLVEMFEHTDRQQDQAKAAGDIDGELAVCKVRGWLMDALESRDQVAFNAWIDATDWDTSPREFFIKA